MGNNPVVMVDPNGELAWFVPLIIGAVINVGVNAAAGNIDNFWQGAGYAAVGAASGAIGSGIASGVSVAISGVSAGASFGSSFAAGFGSAFSGSVGTGVLPAATSSFFSGAAIGAGAGFGAGFVGGVGNGLVGGESFGGALSLGLRNGLLGGMSGGLIGGVAGGLETLGSDKIFFTGKSNSTVPKIKMPTLPSPEMPKATVTVEELVQLPNKYNGTPWTVEEWINFNPTDLSTHPNGLFLQGTGKIIPDYTLEGFFTGGRVLKGLKYIKFINSSKNGSRVLGIDKFLMYIKRGGTRVFKGNVYQKSIKYWRKGRWRHLIDW